MADTTNGTPRPATDAISAGLLTFGNMVVDGFAAPRRQGGPVRRWVSALLARRSAAAIHRDISRLTPRELRELGMGADAGRPLPPSHSVMTGLTLLALAGR